MEKNEKTDIQETKRKELIELIAKELQETSVEALAEMYQLIAALTARYQPPVAGEDIPAEDRTVSLEEHARSTDSIGAATAENFGLVRLSNRMGNATTSDLGARALLSQEWGSYPVNLAPFDFNHERFSRQGEWSIRAIPAATVEIVNGPPTVSRNGCHLKTIHLNSNTMTDQRVQILTNNNRTRFLRYGQRDWVQVPLDNWPLSTNFIADRAVTPAKINQTFTAIGRGSHLHACIATVNLPAGTWRASSVVFYLIDIENNHMSAMVHWHIRSNGNAAGSRGLQSHNLNQTNMGRQTVIRLTAIVTALDPQTGAVTAELWYSAAASNSIQFSLIGIRSTEENFVMHSNPAWVAELPAGILAPLVATDSIARYTNTAVRISPTNLNNLDTIKTLGFYWCSGADVNTGLIQGLPSDYFQVASATRDFSLQVVRASETMQIITVRFRGGQFRWTRAFHSNGSIDGWWRLPTMGDVESRAPINSPTFTGVPDVPAASGAVAPEATPSAAQSTRIATVGQIAATRNAINGDRAPLASPQFTGVPTVPTPPLPT